jgi:hypothetical protein
MTESKPTRRRFQFGLAALLFVIALLASLFAGFRVGYDRGYVSGENQRRSENPKAMVYNVGDLVRSNPDDAADFDPLVEMLTGSIEPETWSDMGGQGSIDPFEPDQLIINQTSDVHEKISDLLKSIRDGRTKIKPSEPKK